MHNYTNLAISTLWWLLSWVSEILCTFNITLTFSVLSLIDVKWHCTCAVNQNPISLSLFFTCTCREVLLVTIALSLSYNITTIYGALAAWRWTEMSKESTQHMGLLVKAAHGSKFDLSECPGQSFKLFHTLFCHITYYISKVTLSQYNRKLTKTLLKEELIYVTFRNKLLNSLWRWIDKTGLFLHSTSCELVEIVSNTLKRCTRQWLILNSYATMDTEHVNIRRWVSCTIENIISSFFLFFLHLIKCNMPNFHCIHSLWDLWK